MELYLKNLSKRYHASRKHEKGLILEELCESSGYHKKHAIRLLNAVPKKLKRKIKTGRPRVYPENLYLEPLKRIWLLSDQPCGKRLKMTLPLWHISPEKQLWNDNIIIIVATLNLDDEEE